MTDTGEFDRIIVRDLALSMSLGIHGHEKNTPQPVLVNIIIEVTTNREQKPKSIGEVISYEEVVRNIQTLSGSRHFDLVEEYAEEIANICLKSNKAVSCHVSVLKTNILPETSGVGVEIKRKK